MAKKSKYKSKGSVIRLSIFLTMCVIMIVSFFIPAFQFTISNALLGSESETWSLLQVMQSSRDSNAYAVSIMGLIVSILAGIMIITSILQFFLRKRSLFFLNLGLTMLTLIVLSVASGFAVTLVKVGGFGPLYSTSVTFHMAVFCYVLASIVANICAMQRRF